MHRTRRARLRAAAAVLTGVACVTALTGCAGTSAGASAPAASAGASGPAFHGEQPPGTIARPAFALRDTAGNPYSFAERTRGRPTLLYFGYTSCPDECPTAVAGIAAALRAAPASVREQVQVVFVGTDAARDDARTVRRFLDQWSVDFTGLIGSQADVDAAQRAAGLEPAAKGGQVETVPGRSDEHVHRPGTPPHQHFGPLDYGVAHADVIFAYGTQDRLSVLYPGAVRPRDLAADLPLLDPHHTGDPT